MLLRLMVCALLATVLPVRAAVWAEHGGAVIALDREASPYDQIPSKFSVLMWVFPETTTSDARSIFEIPGVFSIGTNETGAFEARMQVVAGGDPEPLEMVSTAPVALPGGQWSLVAMAFDRDTGVLDVLVRSSTGVIKASERGPEAPLGLGVPTGGPQLGASSGGTAAMVGAYGLLVIRGGVLSSGEMDSVYALKRHFGPYDYNSGSNGAMTGRSGALWMLNHAISTLPTDVDAGGTVAERAAVVGLPVGERNVHVFDRVTPAGEEFDRFILVRRAEAVSGFRYVSYREAPLAGFFLIDPGLLAQVYPSVPGISPLAAQLATVPRRPIRVMVSSNSRGVFRNDGSGLSPGNYAHGLIDLKREHTAGVYFRPATRGGGNPWFGLDCMEEPKNDRTWLIDATNGKYQMFSRFWTCSSRTPSVGPGGGLFIEWGGEYEMRCRPEAGSLMTADAPLTMEAHVMAFPGASRIAWKPTRGKSQGGSSIDVEPLAYRELNTEVYGRTWGPNDRVLSNTAFQLTGLHAEFIRPGDAMFISAGPGGGHLSIIKTVQQGSASTVFETTHPMVNTPGLGAILHFGPWHFEKISYTFDPVPEGDDRTWRGLYMTPPDLGEGFPVFALSAWRPGVNGYIIGAGGWGGNGYYTQLLYSEPTATPRWMAESATDLWIQVPAQQLSSPDSMSSYTQAIREGLPGCEIVWAAEGAHPSGTLVAWPEYIRDHAEANGVVGISALNRVAVGSDLEQLADGHRSNLAHISGRGNRLLAKAWCDLLREAAIDPCPADFAEPWGVYDFFDVLSFLGALSAGDEAADLTRDGLLDFFDLQAYLNAFAGGCP